MDKQKRVYTLDGTNVKFLFPLYHFKSEVDQIEIRENISIVRLNGNYQKIAPYKQSKFNNNKKEMYAEFGLVFPYTGIKEVTIFNLITILKLYKNCDVSYINHVLFDPNGKNALVDITNDDRQPEFNEWRIYSVKSSEVLKFTEFVRDWLDFFEKDLRRYRNIRLALNQYSKKYNNTFSQLPDEFLSYSIAFEALLLGDLSELKYKFSIRLSQLLGNTFAEKKKIWQFAKDFYDMRSKIVHGTIDYKEWDEMHSNLLETANSYLRLAFNNYKKLARLFKNSQEVINYLDELALGKEREYEIH